MAALAGRSPHAYALWILSREQAAIAAYPAAAASPSVRILPVIDCRKSASALDETLASVANSGASLEPLVLRSAEASVEISRAASRHPGLWLCPLEPGDRLAANALGIYAAEASRNREAQLIYADDDLIGPGGDRRHPHFKPDWNPELFEHHDFITGASIIRGVGIGAEALVRQALSHGAAPVHIPLVLHHRRRRPDPHLPGKAAMMVPAPAPLVTAIVPTRNQLGFLRDCLRGLRETHYPNVQTIIVDNDSDDPATLAYLESVEREGATVIRRSGAFNFSALNNAAVRHAQGRLLCFLNNDVEMLDQDWLSFLVAHAVKLDIGAVGARLLYADRTIQHAGVVTGIGGGAGHAHRFQREDEPGYFQRARLPQRVSAVTAACMVVEREKFLAVGGFDEAEFPVAFNDVDLCLKLNQRGWQSFYEPRATLIHHESKSRGSDSARVNRARFAGELAALKRKWHTDELRDPYHHPQLSPFTEQFLIGV